MTALVLDSFADDVDESYDPELDHVEDEPSPLKMKTALPIRALFAAAAVVTRSPRTPTMVVPFPEGIGEGDLDDRVFAVKRAFARSVSGWRLRQLMQKPLAVRRTWGKQFSDEFGQSTYTRARHTLLAPYFDAYALALLRTTPVMTAREKKVVAQLGWHNALYNRRMSIAYSQYRPSQLRDPKLVTRADCSGSVAGGCHWAGIVPAGLSGLGGWAYTNTWIQIGFGQRVDSVAKALPGDVFLYGSPNHEAMYLGGGLIWSFGSYPMKILQWNYRSDLNQIRRFLPL